MSSMLLSLLLGRVSGGLAGYFIDEFGAPEAAYSLRLLDSAYAGNCLRVRRSSDNAVQDIGFSGDSINQSALTSFIGANDGFVVTWYDQSGNANDATQPTASLQPRIVNAGTVETESGLPVIASVNGSQKLDTGVTGINIHTALAMLNSVNKVANNFGVDAARIWSTYDGSGVFQTTDHAADQLNTDQKIRLNSGGASIQISSKPGGRKIISAYKSSSEIGFAENNDSPATAATSSTATNTRSIMLMNDHDNTGSQSNESPINMSEFVLYSSDQSAFLSSMVDNLNTYYSVY